jgi:hypothetical protein
MSIGRFRAFVAISVAEASFGLAARSTQHRRHDEKIKGETGEAASPFSRDKLVRLYITLPRGC